ncbi:MAG: cytidine deaminase [Bacillota bacterium]
MHDEQRLGLVKAARSAALNAYAPYSRFRVGAALLTVDGKVYTGCNVENASYPATVCAERVAICKAVSEGETRFEAIAIACDSRRPCSPCGICRQVMAEFAPDMRVIMVGEDSVIEQRVTDLLPYGFGPGYLTDNEDE